MKLLIIESLVEILENLDTYSEMLLNNLGIWGAVLSCFLITIESILPILPLCVFVFFFFDFYFLSEGERETEKDNQRETE